MRNFKRFLTLALAMVMLVSAFAMGTSAAKFTDVDEENEYLAKAVNLLSYIGVTKGTTETTFGTEELVTREQMAAFIYRLMKKGNSVEGGDNTSAFTDLEDATFFFMVSWANNQGIIKGTSATTFEPKGSITLQDAYTMIVRALGYEKEETLAYPYGYIDVAEAKGVELGEGLDSSVSYTDALTRGDVAILLYNAFFAETGVAETKQVEREIGEGDNATWVLETVTEYPTFCEKYFDVLEVEYQAIATPNYVFGEADETTAELGYEAIEFVYVGEERTEAPAQFYAAYEDLGLDGDANDYIMSHFTMYVILDDDDEIEEILYAEPLMTSKTVTDLELGTVTTNTANSYLDSDYTVKVLNGKVTVDGDAAYFYGAPYSYATPKYATGWDDAEKYAARNAKNLKFIEFATIGDVEDGEYAFYETPGVNFEYDEDGYNVENAKALIELLKEVYVGGLYEADVYDVDGDGLYDYILYMPYEAYFVDTDEDETFAETGIVDGVVYTNEAVLAGVEFENEDYVIGYFDQAANYINVAAVVEPIEGKITAIKKASGMITLNGETKVSVVDGWKTVANDIDLEELNYVVKDYEWTEFEGLLSASVLDEDDDAKFYVYNDVLLYQEGIDSFVKFNDNLLIVTADEEGTISETGAFNSATGKRTTYVHVYVDGETKYVPLNTEAEVYPEYNDDDYVNQLATYSVDGDGLYTIELLGYAVDEDDEYVGITWVENLPEDNDLTSEDNDEIQAYGELGEEEAYFVKNSTRFSLRDGNVYRESSNLLDFELYLTDKTVVIVKNTYTDDDEDVIDFIKLGKDDIKDTVVSSFTNVKYIVENNVDDDNREYLVLLYAEVNGTEFELKESEGSKKNERIVKMMDVAMNEDGKYYAVYDLFNPYTGAVVENVPGTQTGSSSSFSPKFTYGDVVEISTDDKVMDKTTDKLGNIVEGGNANENVYLVVEYIASENAVVLAPVPGAVGEEEDLEDVVYAQDTFMVDVSDAKVTITGHQGAAFNTDMVRWGSLKVADVAKLDGSDKSYLATAKYAEENKPLKTVYAEYVKVYADIDWEDEDDHTVADEETDFNGEANFLVVVANTGENLDLCKLK